MKHRKKKKPCHTLRKTQSQVCVEKQIGGGGGEILGSERTKKIKGKKPYCSPPEMQAVKKQSQK